MIPQPWASIVSMAIAAILLRGVRGEDLKALGNAWLESHKRRCFRCWLRDHEDKS